MSLFFDPELPLIEYDLSGEARPPLVIRFGKEANIITNSIASVGSVFKVMCATCVIGPSFIRDLEWCYRTA